MESFYYRQVLKFKETHFYNDSFYAQLKRSKVFIETNFSGPVLLDHLAAEAFFSKFHFIRVFRNAYGRTPNQYLTEVRMGHAKKLLKAGGQVNDVSHAVGFNSSTSFAALFKKNTGMSPSSFIKSKKSNFE